MRRKFIAILVSALMLTLMLAACAADPAPATPAPAPAPDAPADPAPAEPEPTPGDEPAPPPAGNGEITFVNNKVEIHGALSAFGRLYYEMFGVYVDVQSFGGETPYAPALSAMFAGGLEPEIFVFEGIAGYQDARGAGRVFDMTGQPWLADTDFAYISPTDGNPVGFPVNFEGWGLAYNRRILQEAGVDPATMVNVDGIRAAFETIYAQMDELGLSAVVSITAGAGMEWVTGLHGVNAYLSLDLDYEDTTIIDMLLAGEVDTPRLTAFAE